MPDVMFRADLDRLGDVVRRLGSAHAELDALADSLHRHLGLLHDTWDGAAAAAHVAAQAQWDDGFGAMRAALADMRSAADRACTHYSDAADTNLTMWRRLG